MAADEYWFPEKYVRPRLSRDELWTLYRLVDDKYWLLRRGAASFVGFSEGQPAQAQTGEGPQQNPQT